MQVLHSVSINASPGMRQMLITPTLKAKFQDIANGRSNTLAAGLCQLLHDWEYLFQCAPAVKNMQYLVHHVPEDSDAPDDLQVGLHVVTKVLL
jgi:hypothetical protein